MAALLQSRRGVSNSQLLCHDRYGYANTSDFDRRACTLCYEYLFPSDWPAYVAMRPDYIYLIALAGIRGVDANWTGRDKDKVSSFE